MLLFLSQKWFVTKEKGQQEIHRRIQHAFAWTSLPSKKKKRRGFARFCTRTGVFFSLLFFFFNVLRLHHAAKTRSSSVGEQGSHNVLAVAALFFFFDFIIDLVNYAYDARWHRLPACCSAFSLCVFASSWCLFFTHYLAPILSSCVVPKKKKKEVLFMNLLSELDLPFTSSFYLNHRSAIRTKEPRKSCLGFFWNFRNTFLFLSVWLLSSYSVGATHLIHRFVAFVCVTDFVRAKYAFTLTHGGPYETHKLLKARQLPSLVFLSINFDALKKRGKEKKQLKRQCKYSISNGADWLGGTTA